MTIGITDGTNVVTFGSGGFGIIDEVTIRANEARRIVRSIPRSPANPFVDAQAGGELEWSIPLRISGTSADDLSLKIRTLNAILTAGGTLTDKLHGGSTTISYVLNPSLPIRPNRTRNSEARSSWEGELTLFTTAVATGSPVTLYTAEAITGPTILATSWLYGDAPAPLDVTIATDSWSLNGMRQCYVGLTPTTTLADYLYEAESATGWTVYTDADAGPGASNNAQRTNSATWDALDFGAVPAGRYRVVVRCIKTTGDTGELALSEDGATAYQTTTLGNDEWRLTDLGEWQSDGVGSLYVLGKGSDYVAVDYLLIFPVDDGVATFTDSDHDAIQEWALTDAPTVSTASVTYPAARYMTGAQLYCPCAGRGILIACVDVYGTIVDPDLLVDVSYTPQFYTWADS